ncbi:MULTISPECIES: sporulation histidine kinase inhibitor Sda [Bacillaceae]|uniref:Sporulation protein n=1 Tax=Pseudobacillus wudalianchiensis TaxID=1743143 RepID=A0A1B9B8T8_9BACI|nr:MULTISPECIES: sporulation histidine kinase inhibitor Sda [Bacillus]OCA92482.1 sporulation protein [Bacillus wudalianchiensis]
MNRISDDLLLEAYTKARKLDLSRDFILLIEDELKKRALYYQVHAH